MTCLKTGSRLRLDLHKLWANANRQLVEMVTGGLLLVFSLWWLYLAKPAQRFLTSNRVAFVWGYGHYFVFAALAAVGAGLAVN